MSEKINEIIELFATCEETIDSLQRDEIEVMIPPINQLRYGFKHLLSWHNSNMKDDAELEKSLCHCKRALFDAYDARILYSLETIKQFDEDYRNCPISEIDPNYLNDCTYIEQIRDHLIQAREEHYDERVSYYTKIQDDVEWLRNYCRRLPALRKELNKNNRYKRISLLWVILIAIFSAALGYLFK